jgi:hypothetical protein
MGREDVHLVSWMAMRTPSSTVDKTVLGAREGVVYGGLRITPGCPEEIEAIVN